jgi:hypothetical protein
MISTLLPISEGELAALSLPALVQRMDDVRFEAEIQRYGSEWVSQRSTHFPFPRVADLMSTAAATSKSEDAGRRLAELAFRFLLQMDLLSVASGIGNAVVYGPGYHEGLWLQPSHRMKSAVLDQYQIIASRIALECFFDLLYMVDRGTRMPGDSKFKSFRKWVLEPANPYKYFVGHVIKGYDFDRIHRQREVHGTSRFAREMLRLEPPGSNERNLPLELNNVLMNVWQPLILIMNGDKPGSISVFQGLDDFAQRYFQSHTEPEAFDDFLGDLINERMTSKPA